jgi:hypothetical protein
MCNDKSRPAELFPGSLKTDSVRGVSGPMKPCHVRDGKSNKLPTTKYTQNMIHSMNRLKATQTDSGSDQTFPWRNRQAKIRQVWLQEEMYFVIVISFLVACVCRSFMWKFQLLLFVPQAGRSRVQFPMRSLDSLNVPNPPSRGRPWGLLSL